jgi:hypothetical protein
VLHQEVSFGWLTFTGDFVDDAARFYQYDMISKKLLKKATLV